MADNLIATQDGSLTLYDAATHQHYHNRAGAYAEAFSNYAEPSGILDWGNRQPDIVILDACYGLGYNTWTLINELLKQASPSKRHLEIQLVETNPSLLGLSPSLLEQDCYNCLKPDVKRLICNFLTALEVEQSTPRQLDLSLSESVCLTLTANFGEVSGDIRQAVREFGDDDFDLVFHDPFSANQAPHLWSVDLFRQYYRCLKPGGQLLTYSLATGVRAGLLEAGFSLMKSRGVGDKTGGTVAFKGDTPNACECVNRQLSEPFTPEERKALATRSGVPYRDPELSANATEIMKTRALEQQALKA